MSNKLLETDGLVKRFGSHVAVDGVSLSLDRGEVLGLLGPNGAGKSTTMTMLAGLLAPDAGEIRLDGVRFSPKNVVQRRRIGLAPQDLAIYPDLTARENLEFFGRLYGLKGSALRSRVDEVLAWIGLGHTAAQSSATFSGGMKRRLNFGVALVHEPALLILDEPTVGVDPQSRAYLLDCVRQLAAQGVGVLYASHYMEEVQAVCQRVAIVDHGRLVACDRLEKLLEDVPADLLLHVSDVRRASEALGPLVKQVKLPDGNTVLSLSSAPRAWNQQLSKTTRILEEHDIALERVETQESNLERLFLKMTGSRLRD